MTKESLGMLIIWLRQKKNLLQKDLANIMNISASAVSKWEKGVNYPDVECMQKLAEYFHLSINDLFEPEKTLQRFKNSTYEEDSSDTATPDITITSSKNMFSKWIIIGIILSTAILLCVSIGFFHLKDANSYSARLVAERIDVDSTYGKSYDFAVLVQGKVPPNKLDSLCEEYLTSSLLSNLIPDTLVYRFYYYSDEKDALLWKNTTHYHLLFL